MLKQYASRSHLDVAFDIWVLDHLEAAGFPAPAVVRWPDGTAIEELLGRPAVLMPYVAGEHPSVEWRTDAAARIARLHVAVEGRRPAASKDWHDLSELDRAETAASELAACGLSDLVGSTRAFRYERVEACGRGALRVGVVHGDPYPGNMLVAGGDLTGVIDWDNRHWGVHRHGCRGSRYPMVAPRPGR